MRNRAQGFFLPSVGLLLAATFTSIQVSAQPVLLSRSQLDQLVARIALYPDPLLAQILTASTYWNQIPEAAAWAAQHSYQTADAWAKAFQEDNLPWDPSVLALLQFPSVLNMLASDPAWVQQLGNAVLTQRADLMDAVQRMRRKAMEFGYLQSNNYVNVADNSGYIEVLPANPGVLYVPVYDPLLVFTRPGISGAIRFSHGFTIGASFFPWWWAGPAFVWPSHRVIIDRHPWERHWENREHYIHPYAHPWVRPVGPRVEHHEVRRR